MLRPRSIQPAENAGRFNAPLRRAPAGPTWPAGGAGEDELSRPSTIARLLATLAGLASCAGSAPAMAEGTQPAPSWLDPALLAAAKAERSLIVYSSTNEQEGLPLFKLFTDATGINVEYVRASDAVLMSRMAIEFRADQKSYDVLHTGTINKMPAQMLASYEPPEVMNIAPVARDPSKRWWGVYANYNTPAYNTEKVKAA